MVEYLSRLINVNWIIRSINCNAMIFLMLVRFKIELHFLWFVCLWINRIVVAVVLGFFVTGVEIRWPRLSFFHFVWSSLKVFLGIFEMVRI